MADSSVMSERKESGPVFAGVVLVLLFLFLYNINFSFLPVITSRLVLLVGMLWAIVLAVRGARLSMNRDMIMVLGFGTLSFVYSLVNLFLHGFLDASLTKGTALILVHSAFGGFFFALLFSKGRYEFRGVVKMLHAAITLQAVFIVLFFVSAGFREFNLDYIVTNSNLIPSASSFRSRGIAGSYGASLALAQSFGLLFGGYLIVSWSDRLSERIYLVASFVLIVASVMLTGRTGLLMLPVVLLYFALVAYKGPKGLKSGILPFFLISGSLVLGLFGLKFGAALLSRADSAERFNSLLNWIAMEVIVTDDGIRFYTLDVLLKHVFFPDQWNLVVFGDPATWDLHRVPSDIGPIRLLFGSGVLGTVLFYMSFIVLFFSLVQSIDGYREKLFLGLLCVFLLVTEFKEPFLMKVNVNSYLFILFFYLQLSKPGVMKGLQ